MDLQHMEFPAYSFLWLDDGCLMIRNWLPVKRVLSGLLDLIVESNKTHAYACISFMTVNVLHIRQPRHSKLAARKLYPYAT